MIKFAERLTEILRQQEFSYSSFARKIKVTPDAVRKWCNDERQPNFDMLILIAKTLHESTDYLLGVQDD
jgi:transcriptional regulator with XRE-family HTH domain